MVDPKLQGSRAGYMICERFGLMRWYLAVHLARVVETCSSVCLCQILCVKTRHELFLAYFFFFHRLGVIGVHIGVMGVSPSPVGYGADSGISSLIVVVTCCEGVWAAIFVVGWLNIAATFVGLAECQLFIVG